MSEDAVLSAARARQLGLSTATIAVAGQRACIPLGDSLCLLQLPGNLEVLTQISVVSLPVPATCACFDKEGTRLITGGDDKQVRLWDQLPPTQAPTRIWSSPSSKKIGCVAFSPDGGTVLWADLFGEVYAVSVGSSGEVTPVLVLGHLSPISHLAFHPTAPALLTADREGHVRSSQWPAAYVIDCYYLEHNSPLSLMLPLQCAPLVLTAATAGTGVCVFRVHTGDLLCRISTEELMAVANGATEPAGASVAAAAAGASSSAPQPMPVACGCEIPDQGLVALGDRSTTTPTIHFITPKPDGSLVPRPELACQLPPGAPGAVALAFSAGSGVLCALLGGGEGVALFPVDAQKGGFRASGATVMRLSVPPRTPTVAPGMESAAGDSSKDAQTVE